MAADGLVCVECGITSQPGADGWQAHLTDDKPPVAVMFCHACAEREFGPDAHPGQDSRQTLAQAFSEFDRAVEDLLRALRAD